MASDASGQFYFLAEGSHAAAGNPDLSSRSTGDLRLTPQVDSTLVINGSYTYSLAAGDREVSFFVNVTDGGGALLFNQQYSVNALIGDPPSGTRSINAEIPLQQGIQYTLRYSMELLSYSGSPAILSAGGGFVQFSITPGLGPGVDCNGNGNEDSLDIFDGTSSDCNSNGVPDECELIDNDCNGDGVPDECEPDCNSNGLPDSCEFDAPPLEIAKLTASDAANGDNFGYSISISGNTAVIGALGDDHAGGTGAGSAYVFRENGGVWQPIAKLTASDAANFDQFGISVSISGDTAVIGAYRDSHAGGTQAGSAYVFREISGVWQQIAKLTASDAASGDWFGSSVSISGDTAVIGAYRDSHAGGTQAGSAYVFREISGVWQQIAKLTASDAASSDLFGISVAINGNTAAIGAHLNDHAGGFDAGSAYVFQLPGIDCNGNGIPDECDIADMTSADCNENGIPDECETAICDHPDFVVTSISFPDIGVAGESIDVRFVIENTGTADAVGTWTDRVYFSADDQVGDDLLAGSAVFDGLLGVGQYYEQIVAVALPANAGVYHVVVRTDATNSLFEGVGESNNDAVSVDTIHVLPIPRPNLVVAPFSVPLFGLAGQEFDLRFTVRNEGSDTAVGPWNDRVYFSSDDQIGGDTAVATLSYPAALAPDFEYERVVRIRLPGTPGPHWVVVKTDADDAVEEGSGESDNTAISDMAVEVQALPLADLVVENVVAPGGAVVSGTSTLITWKVRNIGVASTSATQWVDEVFLSTAPNLSLEVPGGDQLICGEPFYYLAARVGNQSYLGINGEYTSSALISIPPHIQANTVYVYVVADRVGCHNVSGNVSELSDTNNLSRSENQFSITLQSQADLVAADNLVSYFPPEVVPSASSFTVNWVTSNEGAGPTSSGTWMDDVYLSTNSNRSIDAGDILLGQRTRSGPPLAATSSDPMASITRVLPQELSGLFFVKIRIDKNNNVSEIGYADNNIAVSNSQVTVTLSPPPNLRPVSVQPVTVGFPAHPISVTYETENAGAPPVSGLGWRDELYLSTAPTLEGGTNILLGSVYRSTFFQNGQYVVPPTATLNSTMPVSLQAGQYHVIVKLDADNTVSEGNDENDNILASDPILVTLLSADLRIAAGSVGYELPTSAVAGQSVSMTWTVSNEGTASTPVSFWYDAVYLSADQTLGGGDVRLAMVTHNGALAVGASYVGQRTVQIHPSTASGLYYLLFVTDDGSHVYEQSPGESNNVSSTVPFVIHPPDPIFLADLKATQLSSPPSTEPGAAFVVEFRVQNSGNVATAVSSWRDRIYLSVDHWPDSGDIVLATVPRTQALGVGQEYVVQQLVNIPIISGGEYRLILGCDVNNEVLESSESNNLLNVPIFVDGPPLPAPNLAVTSVLATQMLESGGSMDVTWIVQNGGELPTPSGLWRDSIYLSVNSALTPDDLLLGEFVHSGVLNDGDEREISQQFSISCAVSGSYYVIVRTDSAGHIDENGRESDNSMASEDVILIQSLQAPNLRVQEVSAPTSIVAGQSVGVSWTTVNGGAGPTCAVSWRDAVYLSLDLILDPQLDRLLGTYTHSDPLGAGESRPVDASFVIPPGLSGPYFVIVRADAYNQVGESLEVDNDRHTNEITHIVLPSPGDLIVSSVSTPEGGLIGEEVEFAWSVENAGDVSVTGVWSDSIYLSDDVSWDVNDMLVERVQNPFTNIPGGHETATFSKWIALPAVAPGDYHVIVRADILNQIPETDINNNIGHSTEKIHVGVRSIELGQPLNLPLPAGGSQYLALAVPNAGETVKITLDHDSADAWTQLYVRKGEVPSVGQFDLLSDRPNEANQTLFIPTTEAAAYYILARATAGTSSPSGVNATILATIVPFGITSVMPPVVGNGDRVTLRIGGSRLGSDVAVELRASGGLVIAPEYVRVVDGQNLRARFDLSNAPLGLYDVALIEAGGQVVTLPGAVTIEPASELATSITGNGELDPRAGTAFIANGVIQNSSNVDVPYVTILADFSGNAVIGWSRPEDSLPRVSDFSEDAWAIQSPTASFFGGHTYDTFYIRDLGPSEAVSFSAVVTEFVEGPFNFELSVHPGTYEEFASGLAGRIETIRQYLLNSNFADLPAELQSLVNDQAAWKAYFTESFVETGFIDGPPTSSASFGCDGFANCAGLALIGPLTNGLSDCTFAGAGVRRCVTKKILQYGSGLLKCYRNHCNPQCSDCEGDQLAWRSCSFLDVIGAYFAVNSSACGSARGAIDPNEKSGPSGTGGTQRMVAARPLQYTIHFENLSSASAHAGTVRITDKLSAAHNLGSVRFGDIRIGDVTITDLRDRFAYSRSYDLTESKGIILNVIAGVDSVRREAYWILQSIDPNTGLPPADPNRGILPPEDGSGRGTGYVELLAAPSPSAGTGAPIPNESEIAFDSQAIFVTNTVMNTLDADRPASSVTPLPPQSPNPQLPLTWTGVDPPGGSGLAGFSVMVQSSASPLTTFQPSVAAAIPSLIDTLEQAQTFEGQPGRRYWFFSVAKDRVGNLELAPVAADAETYIPLREPNPPEVLLRTAATVNLGLGLNQTVPQNPAETEYAVIENNSGRYLGTDGRLQATPFWQPAAAWPNLVTIRALQYETVYGFRIMARNAFPGDSPLSSVANAQTRISGDVNGDGVVTQADVDIVTGALGTQYGQAGFVASADLNGDSRVNFSDFALVSSALPCSGPGTGDFDGSGAVGLSDIQMFVSELLNPSVQGSCVGDVNGDGRFDGLDIQYFVDLLQ
ncbi:MAG: hypothetical protein KF841_02215 [Phycisphaerae bacterium]|nr:hypothetical protein [Phycisphaerae bacterium]